MGYLRAKAMSIFRPNFNARGQLAIPFLFVFPSIFLFLFLIIETAKLSRQKIRHQFAIDTAAFLEMSNYSDLLNNSAYVNGAFPQSLFEDVVKPAENNAANKSRNETPDSSDNTSQCRDVVTDIDAAEQRCCTWLHCANCKDPPSNHKYANPPAYSQS